MKDQHCLAREKQSHILWSLHAGVLSEVQPVGWQILTSLERRLGTQGSGSLFSMLFPYWGWGQGVGLSSVERVFESLSFHGEPVNHSFCWYRSTGVFSLGCQSVQVLAGVVHVSVVERKIVFVFCTHGMIIFLPKEGLLVFWAMLSKFFRVFHGTKAGKGSRLGGPSLTHPWEWGHHSPCPLSFPSGSCSRLPALLGHAFTVQTLSWEPIPGVAIHPISNLFPSAITSCLELPTSFLPSFLSLILPPGPLFPKLVCLRCWLWRSKWK